MIYIKYLDNVVQPTILKMNNMIFMFIGKRFVNLPTKNTMQYIFEKRENVRIIKIYYLKKLLIYS